MVSSGALLTQNSADSIISQLVTILVRLQDNNNLTDNAISVLSSIRLAAGIGQGGTCYIIGGGTSTNVEAVTDTPV